MASSYIKYTWDPNTKEQWSIVDYMIIKQKFKFILQDTRVFRGTECGSDHYIPKYRTEVPFSYKTTHPVQ